MIELEPPVDTTIEAVLNRLSAELAGVREIRERFYDTFDGLARAAGATVARREGRLVLLDVATGEERASVGHAGGNGPVLAGELEPGPFRDAVSHIIDVRALLPLVDVDTRVESLNVLDRERKTVVRVALERPAIVSPSGLRTELTPRIRLTAVRGYESELDRARARLGYPETRSSLVDEAVRASGRKPDGVSSKPKVALSRDQRADAAAVTVLRRLLEVVRSNLEGTIADTDSEFLHDFRVAIRRTRSVLREFKGVFAPGELERFRIEFRWLQQVTGEARDLDVYVLEFDDYRAMVPEEMRADLDPLRTVLRGRRLGARREMVRALRSQRYTTLIDDWDGFLVALVGRPEDDRPDAARPIAELAAERISRVYSRMVKKGREIDPHSPPEAYHDLRKKGKELRYLLELFAAPLYPSDVVKPMIKALKGLQDVLGRHQDREVQVATVSSLRDEVSALPGGGAALMAMGVLIERLRADEAGARDEFADHFAAFAGKSQRQLVKATFA